MVATAGVAFAVAFLMGVSSQAASAGSAVSSTGYYTVAGIQYLSRAHIATTPGQASAGTWVERNGASTPGGYAGARGRLFTSGGSLSCEGSTLYNDAGYGVFAWSCTRSASGSWYSYGVGYGWNGSSYSPFYTFTSPSQTS